MTYKEFKDDVKTLPPEPRWLQCGIAAMGASIAVVVAIWGLTVPGPVWVGGIVLGEAIGWSVFVLYVRKLAKARER